MAPGRNPVASDLTRVVTIVIGAATILGGLVGYVLGRVIVRGD